MANKLFERTAILLILFLAVCFSEENSQNSNPVEEYIQIFRGIPALFEYLLDVVERRPEILEDNRITQFEDGTELETNYEVKRDVSDQTNKELKKLKGELKIKRDTACNGGRTEKNEYGNGILSNIINKDKGKVKRQTGDIKMSIDKSKSHKMNEDKVRKRNSKEDKFGDNILGSVDWNKFYLAPDEVEEYALKVEKAIEENIKKQRNK